MQRFVDSRFRQDGDHRTVTPLELHTSLKLRELFEARSYRKLPMNAVWALDFMRDTLYSGRVFRTLECDR